MLIHIFVDNVIFSYVPKKTITIILNITIEGRSFELSAPLCDEVAANFCKTIHVPVPDNQAHTTDLDISANAFTVDGISYPLGTCHHTITTMEHGTSKKLYFATKKSAEAGSVVVSVFYYRFPMDIADFSTNDQAASEQQQKYIREYTFLRSRRQNWSGNRASTWNRQTQRLLDEDVSVPKYQSPRDHPARQVPSTGRGKSVVSNKTPKLRKTMMSVGYVGINWPESDTKDEQEKIMHRLHVAETKRLHLLKQAAERARCRNRATDRKTKAIAAQQQQHGRDTDKLRLLLHKREEALKKLTSELEESERRAAMARRGRPRERERGRGEATSHRHRAAATASVVSLKARSRSAAKGHRSGSRRGGASGQYGRRRALSCEGGRGARQRGEREGPARYPRSSSADSPHRRDSQRPARRDDMMRHVQRRVSNQTTSSQSRRRGKGRSKGRRYPPRVDGDANALDLVIGRRARLGTDDDSLSILIDMPPADSARMERTRKISFLEKIREIQTQQQQQDEDITLRTSYERNDSTKEPSTISRCVWS